jgi:hypothetical protein
MKTTLYIVSIILVLVSITLNLFVQEGSLLLNLEILISGLSISFVTGSIVYFMTVDYPRRKLNKSRINLVKEELDYKLKMIKRRLNWLNGLSLDSSLDEFNSKLASLTYSQVTKSKDKHTVYDVLSEIKQLVEEFREYATPIILLIDDDLGIMEGFKDYLQRPAAISNSRMFVKNKLDVIKNKPVEIGDELHNLILKMLILKKEL